MMIKGCYSISCSLNREISILFAELANGKNCIKITVRRRLGRRRRFHRFVSNFGLWVGGLNAKIQLGQTAAASGAERRGLNGGRGATVSPQPD